MKRLILAVLLAVSCSNGPSTPSRTVTVFAAASLQLAFAEAGRAFEAAHPGVQVRFSFAGSQALVAQVEQGAPADLIATADLETINQVRSRLITEPAVFAHNQLAIVAPPGNPRGFATLQDLVGVRLATAGPTVPLGKATDKALAAAGVSLQPVSREDSVSGVVTKVRLGEVDAGIGYLSDLVGELDGVAIPGTTTSLAMAALTDNPEGVAFMTYVRSGAGQRILQAAGFT